MTEKTDFINVWEIGNSIIKMIKEKSLNKDGCCKRECGVFKNDLWDLNFCVCECKEHNKWLMTTQSKKEVGEDVASMLSKMLL